MRSGRCRYQSMGYRDFLDRQAAQRCVTYTRPPSIGLLTLHPAASQSLLLVRFLLDISYTDPLTHCFPVGQPRLQSWFPRKHQYPRLEAGFQVPLEHGRHIPVLTVVSVLTPMGQPADVQELIETHLPPYERTMHSAKHTSLKFHGYSAALLAYS